MAPMQAKAVGWVLNQKLKTIRLNGRLPPGITASRSADFLTVFDEHISTLIEKSVFFSLRNNGSIHKIKGHVPLQLHPKIKKQTCPTTIISRLSKNFLSGTSDSEKPIVAINAAFDRVNLRISGNMQEMFGKFNEVINLLEQSELEPVMWLTKPIIKIF